jgi:hypothetical protein
MGPLGRLACRWEDDIKMYLKDIGCVISTTLGQTQSRVEGSLNTEIKFLLYKSLTASVV